MATDPFAQHFPHLNEESFSETSPGTTRYNCIAWETGQTDVWWWPDNMMQYFWPPGVPREETLDAFFQAFGLLGYVRCQDDLLEAGFEKVALYASGSSPKHAARQLQDGRWTSKLGGNIDITHTLRGLEGPGYGRVVAFLKRPLSQPVPPGDTVTPG